MSTIRITAHIDLDELTSLVQDEVSSITEVSGVGADGQSEYLVEDAMVAEGDDPGTFIITFECTRESGKFAPKDDLGEDIVEQLGGTEISVPVTFEY